MKLDANIFKDRGFVLLLSVAIAIGLIGYVYLEFSEKVLLTKSFSGVEFHCRNYEKHGSRKLILKTEEFGMLNTIRPINDCQRYSVQNSNATVIFDSQSGAIYGLKINGQTVLSKDESIDSSREAVLIMYLLLSCLVLGIYIDIKSKKLKKLESA